MVRTRRSATDLFPVSDNPERVLWKTPKTIIDTANSSLPVKQNSEKGENEVPIHMDPENEPVWEPEAQQTEMDPKTQGDLDEDNETDGEASNETGTEEYL